MNSADFHAYALPDCPGVYFFTRRTKLTRGKDFLYIGRATSLRDRVRSYFTDDLLKTRGVRVADMVSKADDISWRKTNSVVEAIILEAELIKRHQPKANTEGKDDRSFNHIVITKEDFPQVLVVRGKDLGSGKLGVHRLELTASYGPFPEGGLLREALKIIRRLFPYRDSKCFPCPFPRNSASGLPVSAGCKPCFNRQIGLCPGVCTGEITKAEYAKVIGRIKLFFEARTGVLVENIERDMKICTRKQEFEKAAELKRALFGLRHIQDVGFIRHHRADPSEIREQFRIEAYDVAHMAGKDMVGVMVVAEGGELKKSDYRLFNIRGFSKSNDPGALRELISRRIQHKEWRMPEVVLVDGNEIQRGVAKALFKDTPVLSVVKDTRHRPVRILGETALVRSYRVLILRLHAEAHRFAISRFRRRSRRAFLS